MKTKLLILSFLLITGMVWGQEMGSFKERHKVNLLGFKENYFKFSLKDSTEIEIKNNILYDKKGDTISYKITKKKQTNNVSKLKTEILNALELTDSYWTRASLNLKDGKVFIYPFRYANNEEANEFFEKNNIYLELEESNNYSFKYRTWQMGMVTIPLKWYVNSKLGNVATDINALFSVGHKWGNTHIVKLAHEKETRQYQRTFSVNGLVGISKIELNESNTIKKDSIEGNVAAISTGISLGVHYRDFTFLVASGFDFPTSNRKSWQFNNIPWIGIGFGYNFLKSVGTSNK